jgi:phage terminase large subunit
MTRVPHRWIASRSTLLFPNGSRIIAGHFQCEQDIDKYLGLEYDIIGIEEATTLTSRKYHDITTSNRTSRPGWRPRIYSTTNPGGVGHAWYRSTYVTPFQQRLETETRFIPATVDDNPFTNVDYRRVLDRLTGWQRRAWLHGDWDIAAGQFFTTFRRDIHVVDHFNVNGDVRWFASLDYGFNHYTDVLLGCTDTDGRTCVMAEHAARGWVPGRHAEAIKTMLQRFHVRLQPRGAYSIALSRFVAGADVFARKSDGLTIADQYREHGIYLRPAVTDRVNGWAAILKGFGDPAAGIPPTLFIHRDCQRLIDCLPSLQHDPNRPEDVLKVNPDDDGIGGDDSADALRYLYAERTRSVQVMKLRGL